MSLDKTTNRLLQFADTGKNATVRSAVFQLTKPALHGTQPKGADWCEVKLEPRMFFQQGFHLWCASCNRGYGARSGRASAAALAVCDPVPGSAFFFISRQHQRVIRRIQAKAHIIENLLSKV